jgi:DNA-binding transcriptional LysR family regulator
MDKLRRMQIFKTVAEVGQFTQAAQNLGVSKSAVSQAIADLETYLGSRLIIRDNRNFKLTETGHDYYKNCARILSDINKLEEEMQTKKVELDGRINMTAPITYGVQVLSPILAEFLKENPQIDLSLTLSESNIDLVQAGLDIAIRIGVLTDSALIARKLSSVRLILCASPDFIAEHGRIESLDDLNSRNCFKYRWTPKWKFTKDGKTTTISPKGSVISDSGEALMQLAIGGNGVCFLPDFIVGKALADGQLVEVLPDFQGHSLPIQAVFQSNRHMPARVRGLIDFMAEAFAERAAPDVT